MTGAWSDWDHPYREGYSSWLKPNILQGGMIGSVTETMGRGNCWYGLAIHVPERNTAGSSVSV